MIYENIRKLIKKSYKKIKYQLSSDVIFLSFVMFICILNFYFYTAENKEKRTYNSINLPAIVIDYNTMGFVARPIILINYNRYIFTSKSKIALRVGQNIIVQGIIENYALDGSFDQYLISLGIVGEIDVQNIYIYPDCNLNCQFFSVLNQVKNNYSKNYSNWFCSDDKKYWFANLANCTDLAGLAVGFSIGGSQNLTDNTKQNFKNLGLTHLIAVSGFQVVLMVDIANQFSERIQMNSLLRRFLQITLIVGLILIVGIQAPVLRAGISGMIRIFAEMIGRKISTLRNLIWAAIILVFWNPAMLLSLSFQLSFAATLGLILLPNFSFLNSEKIPNFLKELISAFLTSLAATLWTLPLIVQINGKISGLSVFVNVLVSPFISFSTILAFFGQIPILGELFTIINSGILIIILNIVEIFAKVNVFINFDKFGAGEMVGYYGFLMIILFGLSKMNIDSKV